MYKGGTERPGLTSSIPFVEALTSTADSKSLLRVAAEHRLRTAPPHSSRKAASAGSGGCLPLVSSCPPMSPRNYDGRIDGTLKMKLQAFGPSDPKSLQSQTSLRSKNRLPLNGLGHSSRPTTWLPSQLPLSFTICQDLLVVPDRRSLSDICHSMRRSRKFCRRLALKPRPR